MMKKAILIVQLNTRTVSAVNVQKILTQYGCIIKTRLGIHDGVLNVCSDHGLVILEIVGSKKENNGLAKKLGALKGIKVKLVELPFN